ncbi:MAG: hypothetical protein Q8L37_05160 [Candidatus Gottesmanbacteria bacterium]|nr:hypothetical protein [Candidatus Gottesmanbacteria bacterium]
MVETIPDQAPLQTLLTPALQENSVPAPEQMAPPSPEAPEYTATQKLMQKLLEVGSHSLLEEGKDVVESREKVAKTLGELFNRIAKNPINIPGHYHEVDAFIRGRDPGDIKTWTARNITNISIGLAATGVDYLDTILTSGLSLTGILSPIGNVIEYLTDSAITVGANQLVRNTTGQKDAHYPSPLSEIISTALNWPEVTKPFADGVNIEASYRILSSIPIAGALVERSYISGNNFLTKLRENKQNIWIQGLLMAATKGFLSPNKPKVKTSSATITI